SSTAGGMGTPGSRRTFSRFSWSSRLLASRALHSRTRWPGLRASSRAMAVPQAPSPRTAKETDMRNTLLWDRRPACRTNRRRPEGHDRTHGRPPPAGGGRLSSQAGDRRRPIGKDARAVLGPRSGSGPGPRPARPAARPHGGPPMPPHLRVFPASPEPAESDSPPATVRVSLGSLLPLLTLAHRHNYLCLQDFLDDAVC